jgi:hypothetical protein
MIEVAHVTGTVAVIKSPHFDLLTPRVSRFGFNLGLHHLRVHKNIIKKNTTKKVNRNHNQY